MTVEALARSELKQNRFAPNTGILICSDGEAQFHTNNFPYDPLAGNLPIISYVEVGTTLTVNHDHAAMMGVFGMLAIALLVFTVRHVSTALQWNCLRNKR